MFSQTAEYALRAVACLARRPGEPMTTRQIADASRVPAGYLAKILQALARAGVVTGQRGLNGGFLLAHRPEELTMLYRNALEQTIRENPSNYLWSHRRWRHDWKEGYPEILG